MAQSGFGRLTRRSFLRGASALAGVAALPPLLTGLKKAHAGYVTTKPNLPETFGNGRTVAVLGAGVAGLTTAYVLANAGFKVTVLEADNRYGGRSLSPRPVNQAYKDWWFRKYNPEKLFPAMYVDRYKERSDSPVPQEQVCTFMDDTWRNDGFVGNPVELFLNAGPGRIPSNHVNLIALCQEIGVDLETYIFQSMSNVMQSQSFNNGKPVPMGQVTYSLYSEMAQMMAEANKANCLAAAKPEDVQLSELAQVFGDLKRERSNDPCHLRMNDDSTRVGFSHLPGGWRDAGQVRPHIQLQDILNSSFVGDPGANPELSPGSFLFNSFNVDWQATLMQPIGGMDRIWQQLLLQDVPATAMLDENATLQGRTPKVGDLVRLNAPVIQVIVSEEQVRIRYATPKSDFPFATQTFDFCVSSMAPSLLNKVLLQSSNVPQAFKVGLNQFSETGHWKGTTIPNLWTPAIKVGWQSKSRFWETQDEIYGGISWTDDIISQIWYPSEDFTAHTGVLTGAYNRGEEAVTFGQFNQGQRINAAIKGLGLLHPGDEGEIYQDRGMTIAWQYMPHQVGGWASDTALTSPEAYRNITTFRDKGRFYCAGDTWSYWPGWQEGSVASAYQAINAIANTIDPTNNAYAAGASYGRE